MATYPLPTLAASITDAGISAPAYGDILESLKASFRAIYGSDAIVDADSQDGQWIAIISKAVSDCNDACKAAYGAFPPSSAIGVGLSANVKINGLEREGATNSQVPLVLNGTPGTVINAGKVKDIAGNIWNLPDPTTITGGTVSVTAIAQEAGDIEAAPHTCIIKATPVAGWDTVDNLADAVAGVPAEKDSVLRQRQTVSVALASQTRNEAMLGAVSNVPGVAEVKLYENDTGSTDANGLPAHSIALVIAGGSVTAIADAMVRQKAPGCYLYGSTVQTVVDNVGVTQTMRWTVPAQVATKVAIDLNALEGYTSDIGDKIAERLSNYVNRLPPGETVYWSRLFSAALLQINDDGSPVTPRDPDQDTYAINTLQVALLANALGTANLPMTFAQEANLQTLHITITPH